MSRASLRRLMDLPGIAELERQAVLKPLRLPGEAPAPDPAMDACLLELFGLTREMAKDGAPADWDGVDEAPPARQVMAFEDAGWDVTDQRRRPLRILGEVSLPLWLAVRGVAGKLPFAPEPETRADDWGSSLAAEAARFKKR